MMLILKAGIMVQRLANLIGQVRIPCASDEPAKAVFLSLDVSTSWRRIGAELTFLGPIL